MCICMGVYMYSVRTLLSGAQPVVIYISLQHAFNLAQNSGSEHKSTYPVVVIIVAVAVNGRPNDRHYHSYCCQDTRGDGHAKVGRNLYQNN